MHKEALTIILVPYAALIGDLLARAAAKAVEAQQWMASLGRARCSGLLYVGIEQANTSEFNDWAACQASVHHTLRQLVVDEAHTPLLSSSYRPSMLNISHLRSLGVRVVLLSGTAPEPLVPQIEHAFGCTQLRVYRDPTDRPNLRYQVSTRVSRCLHSYI